MIEITPSAFDLNDSQSYWPAIKGGWAVMMMRLLFLTERGPLLAEWYPCAVDGLVTICCWWGWGGDGLWWKPGALNGRSNGMLRDRRRFLSGVRASLKAMFKMNRNFLFCEKLPAVFEIIFVPGKQSTLIPEHCNFLQIAITCIHLFLQQTDIFALKRLK